MVGIITTSFKKMDPVGSEVNGEPAPVTGERSSHFSLRPRKNSPAAACLSPWRVPQSNCPPDPTPGEPRQEEGTPRAHGGGGRWGHESSNLSVFSRFLGFPRGVGHRWMPVNPRSGDSTSHGNR